MIVITATFTADVMRSQLMELFPPASQPNILLITQQIFSQLLLSNSEFQKNRSGFNVLLIRLSDLMPYTATPQSPAIDTLYESPQNLLQNKIIAIFAEVLQIDSCLIGSNTEFFDLGGKWPHVRLISHHITQYLQESIHGMA